MKQSYLPAAVMALAFFAWLCLEARHGVRDVMAVLLGYAIGGAIVLAIICAILWIVWVCRGRPR